MTALDPVVTAPRLLIEPNPLSCEKPIPFSTLYGATVAQ